MARPKLGETQTERMQLKITAAEIEAIDDWRFANRAPSRSEAVRRLCQTAIQMEVPLAELVKKAQNFLDETEKPGFLDMMSDEAARSAWLETSFPKLLEISIRALQLNEIMVALQQGASVAEAIEAAKEERQSFDEYFATLIKLDRK